MSRSFVLCLLFFVGMTVASQSVAVTLDTGLGVGIARPDGIDTQFLFTGSVRWYLSEKFAVEPDLGYWKATDDQQTCLGGRCEFLSLRDINVGVNLVYNVPSESVRFFLGGGMSAHFRKTEPSGFVPGNDSKTRKGAQLLWGIELPLNERVSLLGAARVDFVWRNPLERQDMFKLYAGFRVKLSRTGVGKS